MKKKGEMQQRIWNALRWHKGPIILKDLRTLIGVESWTGGVARYLELLIAHGYVRKLGRGRYQMVRNTGPKPPRLRPCLYDPNLKRFMEVRDGKLA